MVAALAGPTSAESRLLTCPGIGSRARTMTLALIFISPTPEGSGGELILLGAKQNIERRHGAVATGDVGLHFHFFGIAQLWMSVDLLLQHSKVVSHHHDFVKERFQRNLLGLESGV